MELSNTARNGLERVTNLLVVRSKNKLQSIDEGRRDLNFPARPPFRRAKESFLCRRISRAVSFLQAWVR